jgi:hypothetical protein
MAAICSRSSRHRLMLCNAALVLDSKGTSSLSVTSTPMQHAVIHLTIGCWRIALAAASTRDVLFEQVEQELAPMVSTSCAVKESACMQQRVQSPSMWLHGCSYI